MKKELLIEGGIYVSVLALASFLWRQPAMLLFCLVVISGLMLRRWHGRRAVFFYGAGFVTGIASARPARRRLDARSGAGVRARRCYCLRLGEVGPKKTKNALKRGQSFAKNGGAPLPFSNES